MDSTTELLQKLQSGQISLAECQEQLTKNAHNPAQVQFKITPKGCIGFYNVRRMPISLYIEELEVILQSILSEGYNYSSGFSQFLEANAGTLKRKPTALDK